MKDTKWGNVRIRQELIDRVSKFLESGYARKLGYTNISQLVDDLVRTKLRRFEFSNLGISRVSDSEFDIYDGRKGDVKKGKLKIKKNQFVCSICKSNKCIHLKLLWDEFDYEIMKNKQIILKPFEDDFDYV